MRDASEERQYFRSATSGELGYLTKDDLGRAVIRLDRPTQLIERVYRPNDWIPEDEPRPLRQMHVAHIAFEADRHLCRYLGLIDESRVDWTLLRDEDRIKFAENGPPHGPKDVRVRLWHALREVLGDV